MSSDSSYDGASDQNAGRAAAPPAGEASGGKERASVGDETDGDLASGEGGQGPQAGTLTAGVWDDNLNFGFFQDYLAKTAPTLGGVPIFPAADHAGANQKWAGQRTGASELDVTFLIDTTGSMGDELSYVQTELDGIANSIMTKFPQTTPRFGLVLYKDHQDSYLTRTFDFEDLTQFRQHLAAQTVGGGGDYPEAVADGLTETMKLSWRTGAVARMAFWLADAPHHTGEEQIVETAISAAVDKDVHVYPVAASGSDARTELTMRTAAQLTGGRYVFLTDDSGVGNSHAEPHIPCYHVTKFNQALIRMVESEMTGTHVSPEADEIVRSVGDPKDGVCQTKSQGPVTIY